jgi:excisionase family DNA binding protein
MTAHADMTAAGLRVLDLLTIPEAALRLGCSPDKVTRLAAAGELVREDMGALARITPESVAAYEQRQAAGAETS